MASLTLGQDSVGCGEVSSIPSSGVAGAMMEQMKLIQRGRKKKIDPKRSQKHHNKVQSVGINIIRASSAAIKRLICDCTKEKKNTTMRLC